MATTVRITLGISSDLSWLTSDGVDEVPWISYMDDTVLRQYYGEDADAYWDDYPADDEDNWLFVESGIVGADAVVVPDQPQADQWDWFPEEPDFYAIECGYQNSDADTLQTYGDDSENLFNESDDDDLWPYRELDPVGADAPLPSSQCPDDAWDWTAEEPDTDEREVTSAPVGADAPQYFGEGAEQWDVDLDDDQWTGRDSDIVVGDAPQYFGEGPEFYDADLDEESTLHLILDDSDDAVDSTIAALPVDDQWDWSAEEPDEDERIALGSDPVGADGVQMLPPDEWDWTAEEPDADERDALGSDPVSTDAVIPVFAIADEWDWSAESDDFVISDDFINSDAPQYFGEVADGFDHDLDDESWHSRDSDIVGADAPQYFGETAEQWDHDIDDDSWSTVQGDSDVVSRASDLFQYFGEDAESWELDPDDFYYVADDYQVVNAIVTGENFIIEDAWDWSDEDPAVTAFPDSYQNVDYGDYQYSGDDAETWDVDPDDNEWLFRGSEPVGVDVGAYPFDDVWDWAGEELQAEAFDGGYQNSDGSAQYHNVDAENWDVDLDDEVWAIQGTDIVGADAVQSLAADDWDWTAEEPDQDDHDHRPDEGTVGADAVPTPIVDDWDWTAEEPDQDDHDDRPSDAIVGPNVGPYPFQDDWDWGAEEPDDDERTALNTDPVGDDSSPMPVDDEWDWSAEEPDQDERPALGSDPVGTDSPQYFGEDADTWDVDLDDDDWLARDTDAVGAAGVQALPPDDWDWSAEEPNQDERDALGTEPVGQDAPQYFGEDTDQWDVDLDDDLWHGRDSDAVGANGAQALPPDDWDWTAEEPDQDERLALGTESVGPSAPQYFGEAADQWDHDIDDELWAVFGNDPVGRDGVPAAQPDPWDWSTEEPEDDLRAFLETDGVGPGAAPAPAVDAWDWTAEEPEDDLRSFLDASPVPASSPQYFGEASDQWDHYVDDDSWISLNTDSVGPNASPFPFPDAWDWSAEEPEDDLRIAIDNQQVGANGVPSLFADAWDWFSEDGADVAGETEISGPVRQSGDIVFAEPYADWSDTGDADDLTQVANSQSVADLNYRTVIIYAPPRNTTVASVPRGDIAQSKDRFTVVTAQSRADEIVAPATNPIIPS